MATLPDVVIVEFEGERSGAGPLSWGQLYSWGIVTRTGVPMCVGGVQELPPGRTLAEVGALLRFVMNRHEVLRTRLVPGADGLPRQELHRSGEIQIEVVDAAGLAPAAVAGQLYERYSAHDFNYETEWPVRMGVVHQDGVLTHVAVAYSHMAVDGTGLHALMRDVIENLGPQAPPVVALQPLDQVERQQSPAGQRHAEAALRTWEKSLLEIPPNRFAASPDPRRPRFWEVGFDSPAMYLAIGPIAARNGVSTSPVLVAAFAVALGEVTGSATAAFQVMVSNRFRPGFGDSVSPTSQGSLCVLEVGGATFDEVVRQAESIAMRTHLCAYYDPAQLDELIEAVGQERGQEIDLSCYFNDRRFETPRQAEPAGAASAAEIVAALPASRLHWGVQMERWNEKLFVHVNDVPGVLQLFACADTDFVSPGQLEACLRGMESAVVTAVCAPEAVLA